MDMFVITLAVLAGWQAHLARINASVRRRFGRRSTSRYKHLQLPPLSWRCGGCGKEYTREGSTPTLPYRYTMNSSSKWRSPTFVWYCPSCVGCVETLCR